MNTSTLILIAKFTVRRCFSTVKRKYPIDRDHVKTVPGKELYRKIICNVMQHVSVFDYGASKKTYKRVFVFGNARTGALGVPYMNKRDHTKDIECYRHPKRLGFAEKNDVSILVFITSICYFCHYY